MSLDLTKKKVSCCLTGHRPSKLPWGYNEEQESCKKFKVDLKEIFIKLINSGVVRFYTGMAEGFDMIATEILLELKSQHKDIEIVAVIPCINQERFWSKSQQKRYNKILRQCDDAILISKEYTNTCMLERNRYMVDNSGTIVACYNGEWGGTRNTLRIAKEKGCKIIVINPNHYISIE